jgi:hypothetical protein
MLEPRIGGEYPYDILWREESLLSAAQGESYRQFLKVVPRLVPSMSPRVAAGGLVPRWRQAVMGETFMWLFAVALACFAATLSQRVFLTTTVAGIAASFLAKAVLRQRGHPN